MKKFILLFLYASLFASQLSAQQATGLGAFTMRGPATITLNAEGIKARHPSLPLNSTVKVANPASGQEIEVTIVGRIDPSSSRLIDLTKEAAAALGIKSGQTVALTVAGSSRRPTTRNTPPVEVMEEPEELAEEMGEDGGLDMDKLGEVIKRALDEHAAGQPNLADKLDELRKALASQKQPKQPINIVRIQEEKDDDQEFLAWLLTMSFDARASRDSRESRESREARESRESREAREARESREAREAREARESREAREALQARIDREDRESREAVRAVRIRYETPIPSAPVEPVVPSLPSPVKTEPAAEPPVTPAPPAPAPIQQPAPSVTPAPIQQPAPAPKQQQPAPAPKQQQPAPAPKQQQPAPKEQPNIPVRKAPAEPSSRHIPPPVKPEDIKIVPGLPDRNSTKLFRLQVGAYSTQNLALKIGEHIKTAGLAVEYESTGPVYRVLVPNVAARDVYSVSARLGAIGFGQIWVRE